MPTQKQIDARDELIKKLDESIRWFELNQERIKEISERVQAIADADKEALNE